MSERSETQHPSPHDLALRAIVEGVEAQIGDRFFSSLVNNGCPGHGTPCVWTRRGVGS